MAITSTVIYNGNLRTTATHELSQTSIETDAPLDNNGLGQKFSPTDLVATALASCMITIMGIKSKDLELDLTGTEVKVEKIMASNPRRIGAVHISFLFPPKLQFTDKQKTILERAAATCPVLESLSNSVEKKVTYNW
jgi:putative redox protein